MRGRFGGRFERSRQKNLTDSFVLRGRRQKLGKPKQRASAFCSLRKELFLQMSKCKNRLFLRNQVMSIEIES